MRIRINETFSNLDDGAAVLLSIAGRLMAGKMDGTDIDFEVELEQHEIDALPVERDEPDMPSRM